MNLIETISHSFFEHIKKTFPLLNLSQEEIEITLNTDTQRQLFGDLTTNAALVIAHKLKQKPLIIAQEIVDALQYEYIAWFEIAGPGFINFFLTPQALPILARQLYEQSDSFFTLNATEPKMSYSLEFVSANPTGPLHLGHGRGGIIGDVLGTILQFLGHLVTKEFYINDAGNQMQKLGNSLKIRYLQLLGHSIEMPQDNYQGEYITDLARSLLSEYGVKGTEEPDSFFVQYGYIHLLKKIKKTLSDYGIHFDKWFSENTLHTSGAIEKAISMLQKNNYIYEKEDALWFNSSKFGDDKDRVVRKSNGELTYVAADIAYLLNKLERADHLIMVLGQDHHSYVTRLKAILQALGKDPHVLDVILYQLVTIKEDGQSVRMSKRSGNMVTLEDIIKTVGKDVARFFYLNRKADAHLDFDIDLAVQHTDENPVYYIQYAYVRTGSILEKALQIPELSHITSNDVLFITENEKALLKKITSLKPLLKALSKNYHTHLLSYYVIELAHQFHRYYNDSHVIDITLVEQSRGRLVMIQILRNTFSLCFKLLGITSPNRM